MSTGNSQLPPETGSVVLWPWAQYVGVPPLKTAVGLVRTFVQEGVR